MDLKTELFDDENSWMARKKKILADKARALGDEYITQPLREADYPRLADASVTGIDLGVQAADFATPSSVSELLPVGKVINKVKKVLPKAKTLAKITDDAADYTGKVDVPAKKPFEFGDSRVPTGTKAQRDIALIRQRGQELGKSKGDIEATVSAYEKGLKPDDFKAAGKMKTDAQKEITVDPLTEVEVQKHKSEMARLRHLQELAKAKRGE